MPRLVPPSLLTEAETLTGVRYLHELTPQRQYEIRAAWQAIQKEAADFGVAVG